jgi:threonine dehydratase
MIGRDDIAAAAERLRPYVRRTPVLRIDGLPGPVQEVVGKLEFLQHTGSFKARGAFNRLLQADIPAAGVIAASGGNHGAAVACAAQSLKVPAQIFVPETTPAAKLARIASYGAEIIRGGGAYADAFAASERRRAETGALPVHAFDQPEVLAGQGTVGMELEQDAPELTHVLVAVGGGGLIGGIAGWYAGRAQVVGVEPEACPTLNAALRAGEPVPVDVGGIAADSLGARQVGALMFAIAQRYGVQALTVPDAAIGDAQLCLWDRLRVVAEPGGAAAFAALLSGAFVPPPGARVGVVLCGANADPRKLDPGKPEDQP